MTKEKELKATLAKFIQKTEEALGEGWIYTNQYRDELQRARQALGIKEQSKDVYPDGSLGFHVIGD